MQGPIALINERHLMLDKLVDNMDALLSGRLLVERNRLGVLTSKLDAISPLKVLSRGYAIAEGPNGILKSVDDTKSGDRIKLTLSDGDIDATVN